MRAFINGRIYVSFKPRRIVDAILTSNGRVIYAGKSDKAERLAKQAGGEVVDLQNSVCLPGFIDSHVHIDDLGIALDSLDLRGVSSIEELKDRVRIFAEKSDTPWIIGHGWDQELMGRYPTKDDLDFTNKPVMLSRICMHAAVLNTKALELVELVSSTGIVKEDEFEIAREKFRKSLSIEDLERYIKKAVDYLISNGVTAVAAMSVDEKALKALLNLDKKGELKIRVFAYLKPELLDKIERVRSDKLKIAGIKVLADGSLGARTAWLSQPYADENSEGYPNVTPDELRAIADRVDSNNLQLAVHSIGDRTLDMILDVCRKTKGRHRIEHASIVRDDQLERVSRLNVAVSVQPHFIITDWWVVRRVGENRARWVYRFKSMIEAGIPVAFGSDAPIEPANPWLSIYAAVTRGAYDGIELYKYTADECLSLKDALHTHTYGSAFAMRAENELGTLEVGKLADFIVLSRDPFEISHERLKDLTVDRVYIGGVAAT